MPPVYVQNYIYCTSNVYVLVHLDYSERHV